MMTKVQLAALLTASFAAGAGTSTVVLLREAPGDRTYTIHKLEHMVSALEDGGTRVNSHAYAKAALALKDGGSVVLDIGGNDVTAAVNTESACMTAILNAATIGVAAAVADTKR